jgi:hypothetical protein
VSITTSHTHIPVNGGLGNREGGGRRRFEEVLYLKAGSGAILSRCLTDHRWVRI